MDKILKRKCHKNLLITLNNTFGPLSEDKSKHTVWVQTSGTFHCFGKQRMCDSEVNNEAGSVSVSSAVMLGVVLSGWSNNVSLHTQDRQTHKPSCRSPFLFSCMASSKLLWRILFSVLIHSSISLSESAANRYALLSCIFSSKANLRTLLF